jgi:hypothetical protein
MSSCRPVIRTVLQRIVRMHLRAALSLSELVGFESCDVLLETYRSSQVNAELT